MDAFPNDHPYHNNHNHNSHNHNDHNCHPYHNNHDHNDQFLIRACDHNSVNGDLHQVQRDSGGQKLKQRTVLHNPGNHYHDDHHHDAHDDDDEPQFQNT